MEIKVCIIGDTNVGKTSLSMRYCHGDFPENSTPTIGASFLQVSLYLLFFIIIYMYILKVKLIIFIYNNIEKSYSGWFRIKSSNMGYSWTRKIS